MKRYFELMAHRGRNLAKYPPISDRLLDKFKTFDNLLGWCNQPNTINHESIGAKDTVWSVDQYGSRPSQITSNPFERRVSAIYGDSFALGREVNDHESVSWFLGSYLKIPFLNFGVGNYGFDQSLLRLERDIKNGFLFNEVIILICTASIARSASIYRHWLEPGNLFGVKPRFFLNKDSKKLDLINNPIAEKIQFKKLEDFLSDYEAYDSHFNDFKIHRNFLFTSRKRFYAEDFWMKSLDFSDALVNKFLDISRKNSFIPRIVVLPTRDFCCRGNINNFYDNLIDRYRKDLILSPFDLLTALKPDKHFAEAGHYNPEGNRLICEHIVRTWHRS